jgi:hypothetical protein
MPTNTGPNVERGLVGGRANQLPSDLKAQTKGNPPQQFRVVVLEVYTEPSFLTEEEKRKIKEQVRNPEYVDNMPPNTILGKVITSGENDNFDLPCIFYPYFQSHFMLPVIPGEHVYVIYEDYERDGSSFGKWVTRIHESRAVEDVNYTHADRRFNPELQTQGRTSALASRANNTSQPSTPSFPNGRNTVDSYTLPPSGSSGGNPYDGIFQQSKASKQHEYEPVPRFTKRADEFVLQGTNNSLIVLGQDRTGPATRSENSQDVKRYAGSIDMVVGRARFPVDPNETRIPTEKSTSGFVVQNSRGKQEIDKTPKDRNKQENRKEGDPDFVNDAARISQFMNSEVDKNFKLADSAEGSISYPDKTLKPTQPPAVQERYNRSYVVGKADHLRFVARKKTNPNIKGTVLIVREGEKDSDLAFMYFNDEGKIQIESKEIFLGKSIDKNEPYIKWSEFKKTVDALQAQIDILVDIIDRMGNAVGGLAPTSVCVPFLPDPAVVGIGTAISSITSPVKSNTQPEKTKQEKAVVDSKSKKIFGE